MGCGQKKEWSRTVEMRKWLCGLISDGDDMSCAGVWGRSCDAPSLLSDLECSWFDLSRNIDIVH